MFGACFTIPHRFKYHNGVKKYILKEITHDLIPKKLMDRPKMGFVVPTGEWLRRELLGDLLSVSNSSFIERQGLFRHAEVNRLIQGFLNGSGEMEGLIWNFYVFQMWYRTYLGD